MPKKRNVQAEEAGLPGHAVEDEVIGVQEPEVEIKTISFEVPIMPAVTGNISRRYDVYYDSMSQAKAMETLSRGLRQTGAKLKNGTEISQKSHVLRWLAEQISEQLRT